jgi:hypothetical protein
MYMMKLLGVVQDTRVTIHFHIMSGFRSIHREQVSLPSSSNEETAIWCVQVTPLLKRSSVTTAANHLAAAPSSSSEPVWRIWTANSDGSVRSYTAAEASHSNSTKNTVDHDASADAAAVTTTLDTLTASAIQLHCTHSLVGGRHNSLSSSMLGCTQLCTIRNYIGEDDTAGDLVVLALGLSGTCRVWVFTDDWDDHQAPSLSKADNAPPPPRNVPCLAEFTVDNATGTTMATKVVAATWQTIVVAVGCLDGTIAIVDTGIATVSAVGSNKDANNEGAVAPINMATAGTLLEYVVATQGFVVLANLCSSHSCLLLVSVLSHLTGIYVDPGARLVPPYPCVSLGIRFDPIHSW